MTKKSTHTALADLAGETVYLAGAGQRAVLDALRAEMGALKALMPGMTAPRVDTAPGDASRRATEATVEDTFDNMPI